VCVCNVLVHHETCHFFDAFSPELLVCELASVHQNVTQLHTQTTQDCKQPKQEAEGRSYGFCYDPQRRCGGWNEGQQEGGGGRMSGNTHANGGYFQQ